MTAYAFMEPAYRALPAARYSATSIPCPSCQAKVGAPCPGPRVHESRLRAALELARRGRLSELADGEAPAGATEPVMRARRPGRRPRWN